LTHLAVEGRVSASTQTQALCALLFLYKHVLIFQAAQALAWQFVFASEKLSRCPRTGRPGRHHLHESSLSNAIKSAVQVMHFDILLQRTCWNRVPPRPIKRRTVQELLGHKDVSTTMPK